MSYVIENHKKGDTWNGLSFVIQELQPDGVTYVPENLTGVTVLIQFRPSDNGSVIFEFKSEDNTVTIPNPLNGEIFMTPRKMDVNANRYIFDVQLTYADGTVITIFDGVWQITNDISRWE